jgi:tryptophanase
LPVSTSGTTIKMPGHRGVITLKSDQRDTLAWENTTLTHAGRFDEKEMQNLAVKVAETHRGGAPARMVMPGPSAGDTPKMHVAKKGTTVTPTSTQSATDQPSDADKKLRISTELEAK